jgi:hypothetical protein
MKLLSISLFVLLLLFQGCLSVHDDPKVISFWTDSEIDSDTEYALYINEEPTGVIASRHDDVICNMIGLINVEIIDNQDMILQIRDSDSNIVDIGTVNLSALSTGITIKPIEKGAIFITHDIDDPCTLVRLRW